MKKENIIELNIGVYTSIKLKINRFIAMDILAKFPHLSKIKNENDDNNQNDDIEQEIGISDLYEVSIYGLYKMANSLDKTFTYKKAKEIFDYASSVKTIIEGEKQACDMLLAENIMSELKAVFTKESGEEVQVVDFKME